VFNLARSQTAGDRAFALKSVGLGALIFCVTIFAYFPAIFGGLLWDDDAHVTRAWLRSLHGLGCIWFQLGATQQYYPLLHSAFWVEHRLWGDSVAEYHLTNILLHAGSACLVVAIAQRLSLPGAWLAGFIFALHPVCVESVAWISEQKNTLSTVFYLSSAFLYLGFDRDRRRSQYAWAFALFLLALLTKTVTATLPAALLVLFWWKRGRLSWNRDVLPLMPWVVFGVAGGLFTAWVERSFVIGQEGAKFALPAAERCLLAGRVFWFYIGKLVWPTDLIFIYPRWVVDASAGSQYLFPVGVLALFFGLGWLAWPPRGPLGRAAAAAMVGIAIFVGTLLPALGFFNVYPFIYSYVADHFQYQASISLIVPLAAGLTFAARSLTGHSSAIARRLVAVLGHLLLATLGLMTWRQSHIYRNSETLYLATLSRNSACWMAHNNLGLIWSIQPGRLNEAIAQYQEALRLEPDDAEAHNNLGNAWSRIPGHLDDQVAQFKASLRLKPNLAETHNNLGLALVQIPGRLDDAVKEYETALRLNPNDANTHNSLGGAWLRMPGHLSDAISQFKEALRLNPDNGDTHNNLGLAWSQVPGRENDAVAQYEEALRLKPDMAEAHNNLGILWSNIPGRLDDAINQFREALRANPEYADAHNDLGMALLQLPGRINEAAAEFEEALRLKPDFAEAHNNRGLALLQSPRGLNEAVTEFEVTLRLKPDFAKAHNNLGLALSRIPGRVDDAISEYNEALRLNANDAEAHNNLGAALSRSSGRLHEAIAQYEQAVQLKSDFPSAWRNLGASWFNLGNIPEAIAAFQEALRLQPNSAEAHDNLGLALSRMPGRSQEAVVQFDAALRIQPNDGAAQRALSEINH
jgi:protein O-mannosyl-transferase